VLATKPSFLLVEVGSLTHFLPGLTAILLSLPPDHTGIGNLSFYLQSYVWQILNARPWRGNMNKLETVLIFVATKIQWRRQTLCEPITQINYLVGNAVP
jgi:hypothetical protein